MNVYGNQMNVKDVSHPNQAPTDAEWLRYKQMNERRQSQEKEPLLDNPKHSMIIKAVLNCNNNESPTELLAKRLQAQSPHFSFNFDLNRKRMQLKNDSRAIYANVHLNVI